MLIDVDPSPVIQGDACALEFEFSGRAGSSDRVKNRLGVQGFAAAQPHLDRRPCAFDNIDPGHLLAQSHRHPILLRDVGQCRRDFVIEKWQQGLALVDDRYPNAKRCEHRCIFHTNDASANNDHGARNLSQLQKVVADQNSLPIKSDVWIACCVRATGNDDMLGLDNPFIATTVVKCEMVGIDERCGRLDQFDPVAGKLITDHIDLTADHMFNPKQQIFDLNVLLDGIRATVNPALSKA